MKKNLPNTFILGAPKSGTTSLAAYIDEHPNVFISKPKEPFYWSHDYPELKRRHDMNSLEKYLSLFQSASSEHQVIGEGSTNYLRSEVAIEEIMKFNPNAKFIAMLRNPVEVVHAFHAEVLFSFIETEPDFEKAWAMQDDRKHGAQIPDGCEAPQFLQYREVASYSQQVERLMRLVPEEQRMVIVFDDFKADCASTFQEVLRFLDLPEFEKTDFPRVNAAHGHRFPALSKLVLDPPSWLAPAVDVIRKSLRGRNGFVAKIKSNLRKPQQRTDLREEFRAQLCQEFSAEVRKLGQLLDRDLSHWVEVEGQNFDESANATFINASQSPVSQEPVLSSGPVATLTTSEQIL